jgi:hypothetical protein
LAPEIEIAEIVKNQPYLPSSYYSNAKAYWSSILHIVRGQHFPNRLALMHQYHHIARERLNNFGDNLQPDRGPLESVYLEQTEEARGAI